MKLGVGDSSMVLQMDNLKNIGSLWTVLAEKFGVTSDIAVFERRLLAEKAKFLFEELPSLGCSFMRTLITGEPLCYTARFKRYKGRAYPEFLSTLFKRVLKDDGTLRQDADPVYITRLRQLLQLCYKTEVDYDETVIATSLASFNARDASLVGPLSFESEGFQKAKRLVHRILGVLDPLDIVPRHGSGATSCGTKNWDKYHCFRFVPRLHKVYPYEDYFFYNYSHLCDKLELLTGAEVVDEPHAKLVMVPKDQRGPRIICEEPREFQFIQQGLMALLYEGIASHKLTRGFLNFRDQTINGNLTIDGSEFETLATIDLKDASDRVRADLVQALVPPNWWACLESCRSAYVDLPNGEVLGPLRKFAPMGSAVCFPIEALVFWSLLRSTLDVDVYVYGDDIIVPTECAERACLVLESYDLKVNADKCCYRTPFRESCGSEYFRGSDVGYVKLRRVPDNTIESEVSTVEFANLIRKRYGDSVGDAVRTVVDGLYGPHFTCPVGGSLCYTGNPTATNDVFFKHRWEPGLQRDEWLVPTVRVHETKCRSNPKYHWNEYLRKELTRNREHYKLGQYAVPGSSITYRWKSPYMRDTQEPLNTRILRSEEWLVSRPFI